MRDAGWSFAMKILYVAIASAALALGISAPECRAQIAPPSSFPQQPPRPGIGVPPLGPEEPLPPQIQAQQARSRNNARQQKLVDDTNKLLELATQLKQEVDKTNKDTLSIDVIKKADEIEKLAHSVKERMKG